MSVFFGGEFFAGGFFAELTTPYTPQGGSSGGRTPQLSRGTGRLKFNLPTLPPKPKKKGKDKRRVEEKAQASLIEIAEVLELPQEPSYAAELLAMFERLYENKRLEQVERERRMMEAFLAMEEEAEEEYLLLLSM